MEMTKKIFLETLKSVKISLILVDLNNYLNIAYMLKIN